MRIEELDDGGSLDSGDRREIVRDRAKRALVGVGGRLLFYPTLLYNLLRNRMQAEFRWWNEVDQYILLGAVPFPGDVPCLQQLGVRGVITLNEPYETLVPSNLFKIHGIDHLVIPTRDYLFAPSVMDICRAVDFIHKNASHRRTTYVHCKAGRGRSTTIVLCYLIEYKNMTPIGALEYVRSRRPRVRLAPAQWQAVQEYSWRKLEFPPVQSPKPIYSLTEYEVLITADDFRDQRNLLCKASQTRTIIPTNPIGGDEVLVTEADVEGYENFMKFCNEKSTLSYQNNQTIPGGDEYLLTLEDLEGCEAFVEVCNEKSISTDQCNQTRPMMGKLSCLFASLKVSARRQPAANQLPPVHAY